ncbi:MAG: DUF1799 domain-containing protein [Chitinophagaceae bacterium]
MTAAEHWATPGKPQGGNEGLAKALEAFGAPEDIQSALLAKDSEDDAGPCEVEPENWDSVLVFLACQTQWRRDFAGMDATLIWQGLDYNGVAVVIQMHGHKGQKGQGIFRDIQVMEQAALPILNKPQKRK